MKTFNFGMWAAPMILILGVVIGTGTERQSTVPNTPSSLALADEGWQWVVVHEFDVKHPTFSVGFLDQDFGITVGGDYVYYATDGGKTWTKVLSKDENTGGIDVVFDPHNPNIVFASLWQARRQPFISICRRASPRFFRPQTRAKWSRHRNPQKRQMSLT